MSEKELIEKIKKDMENSGLPLEFHVLNVCSTKNTGRMPSLRYEFQGQPRELDLLAFFEEITINRKKDATLQHTSTDLIVECKKRADKPWIFMSSPSYSFSNMLYHLRYTSDYNVYFASKQLPPLLAQIFPMLPRNYYADASIPRCISYYEAFRDPKLPSDIYKSIDNIVSYLLYKRARRIKGQEEFGTFSEFYLPIIVLDGKLFEASISKDGIEVVARPHIQLRTFHREEIYVIDIVTRDHFAKLFKKIDVFHLELVSAIRRLKLPANFRAKAWSKLKQVLDTDYDGMIAMVKAEARRSQSRKRKVH